MSGLMHLDSKPPLQVRHDMLGFYICTDDETAHEDAGNCSAGFDGRAHWSDENDAITAARKQEV